MKHVAGLKVLTTVVMKSTVFLNIMLFCCPFKVIWHFGGTSHHHLLDWRLNWARNWEHDPTKWLTSNSLCSVISQKIQLFMKCILYWFVLFDPGQFNSMGTGPQAGQSNRQGWFPDRGLFYRYKQWALISISISKGLLIYLSSAYVFRCCWVMTVILNKNIRC